MNDFSASQPDPAHHAKLVRNIIGGPFEWCMIPEGPFLFGEDKQRFELPTFWMAKYPITYSQFEVFVKDPDGMKNPQWWAGLAKTDNTAYQQAFKVADHPRENVTWYQSVAFCRWLAWRLSSSVGAQHAAPLQLTPLENPAAWPIRLPTEAEWEKAARGTDGRIYPWGDQFDSSRCNTEESDKKQTTPVTAYPTGASPYGVMDMAGNIWELTLSNWADNYQFQAAKEINIKADNTLALRGGSWNSDLNFTRVTFRSKFFPINGVNYYTIGFRVCCRQVMW